MSLRLFAALSLPGDVTERLGSVMRGVDGAHWKPREGLHITLRFFGETPEPQAEDLDLALDQVARATPAFPLRLKGAGHFGGAEPHALWIGVAPSPDLRALAHGCERAARSAGFKPESRRFTPHVTLAALRPGGLQGALAFVQRLALFESRPWEVDRFGLFSSRMRKGAPSLFVEEASYALSTGKT